MVSFDASSYLMLHLSERIRFRSGTKKPTERLQSEWTLLLLESLKIAAREKIIISTPALGRGF